MWRVAHWIWAALALTNFFLFLGFCRNWPIEGLHSPVASQWATMRAQVSFVISKLPLQPNLRGTAPAEVIFPDAKSFERNARNYVTKENLIGLIKPKWNRRSLTKFVDYTITRVSCVKLYHVYNNNYNNNCLVCYSYHTTLCQIFTTAIFKPLWFCSNTTLHKADWILTAHCCPLCMRMFSVWCLWTPQSSR